MIKKKTAMIKSNDNPLLTRKDFIKSLLAFPALLYANNNVTDSIAKIRQDWHMHTHQAGGKPDAIVSEMIKTNQNYGLDLMGISEHIDRIDQREEFTKFIATNRQEAATVLSEMRVLIGTESTMIDPKLCAIGSELAQKVDYVMVSCNHYHLRHVENPTPATADNYASHYLDMLMGATELGYADTIGHPFFHNKLGKKMGIDGLHQILKSYNENDLISVLKKSANVNMAFEINPHHADQALDWFRDLVIEARRWGTKFTLGTDAHALASLGYPPRGDRDCLSILSELGLKETDLKWEPIKRG